LQVTETVVETTTENTNAPQVTVTIEFAAYALLILLILAVRLVSLGDAPIGHDEARQALAVWRAVSQEAPGVRIIADSPLMFDLQSISFSILGASEFSARLMGALVGILFTLSPLLFRRVLGSVRTFALCLLLTFSPVLMIVARESDGVLLSASFAVLLLWGAYRYWQTTRAAYAQVGIVAAAGLIFLSEPAGFVLALTMAIAGMVALGWSAGDVEMGTGERLPIRERLSGVPWLSGLAIAVVVVLLVATGFMLNPSGLGMVGQTVGSGLAGIFISPLGTGRLLPLIVSLFYDPVVWIFGITSIVLFVQRGEWNLVERFLMLWLVGTLIASVVYAGGGVQHALWFTLPLVALSSYALLALFNDNPAAIVWVGNEIDDDEQRLRYVRIGRLITAVGMLALLLIFGLHLRVVASAFLNISTSPDGSPFAAISTLVERMMSGQLPQQIRGSFVWVIVPLLFGLMGYFLGGSLWGSPTTLQGGALGVLIFGLFVGLGNGWRVTVADSTNPTEIWHTQATSTDVFLLRQTLIDLSDRQSGGFTEISVIAQAPDDGVIAWVLRDFENARFISASEVSDAAGEGIVILPAEAGTPPIGGGYLGQNFLISQTWSPASLQGMDSLAWWSERRVRANTQISQVWVLWLRQDVFNGIQQ
jgi:hypothetical protein